MKIVGILTEFNPFHSGHAYLLEELRHRLGEDTGIVCVMSGNFVQRGEPALLEKHVRAEAAVRCGADLVLELPVARALASAEHFATGAIYMMQKSGAITHLAFGSECGDVAAMQSVADCLLSEKYAAAVKKHLKAGLPFALCRQRAVEEILGGEAAALLEGANNSLGVEYLKAAERCGWDCIPVTVPRRGAAHDSAETAEFLSGTKLRALLRAGDWETVERYVPQAAAGLYRNAVTQGRGPVSLETGERMLLATLRTMEETDFECLPDCGEGLHHRFYKAVRETGSTVQLLEAVKTKRYAHARLRRILMCAWLEIDREAAQEMPQYLRVLSANGRGREIIQKMNECASLPVLTKPASVRMLSERAQAQFRLEARATELYGLLYPEISAAKAAQEWKISPRMV